MNVLGMDIDAPLLFLIVGTLSFAIIMHFVMAKPTHVDKEVVTSMEKLVDDGDWSDDDDKYEEKIELMGGGAVKAEDGEEATTETTETGTTTAAGTKKKNVKKKGGPATIIDENAKYKVGDRVILKNLIGSAHLNGFHGVVSKPKTNKSNERYTIDLDLLPPGNKFRIAVREANILKEPAIPNDANINRAPVINGALTEAHGRSVAFTFQAVRQITMSIMTKSMPGAQQNFNPQVVTLFSWGHWLPGTYGPGIYSAVKQYLKKDVIVQNGLKHMNKQLNPSDPDGKRGYEIVNNSVDKLCAVKGWNVRVWGEFWIVGFAPDGTYLVSDMNKDAVYKVVGAQHSLYHQITKDIPNGPVKLRISMVPWYGRLVYDSVMGTGPGGRPEMSPSPAVTGQLKDSLTRALKEKRVIERLAQLEVPGGSTKGVPVNINFNNKLQNKPQEGAITFNINTTPTQPKAPNGGGRPDPNIPGQQEIYSQEVPKIQPPITDEELELLNVLKTMKPYVLKSQLNKQKPTPEESQGVWNFIRKGYTEQTNPKKEGIVVNAGSKMLTNFTFTEYKEVQTIEVLDIIVNKLSKLHNNKRPAMVGIDCKLCCARLNYLFVQSNIEGTKSVEVMIRRGPAGGQPGQQQPGGPPGQQLGGNFMPQQQPMKQ